MIDVGKVRMVRVGDVELSDRIRGVMGDLDSLESDMKKAGLIGPIAVREYPDKTLKLLAGGRRFTVIRRHNGEDSLIPARIYDRDLTELEMKSIELSENTYRKDLEWYERDDLIAQIDELQKSIHGKKVGGPEGEGWSMTDTGNMLGITQAAVSQAVHRSKARQIAPDLFETCKTGADASKILKKVDTEILKEQAAERVKQERGDSGFIKLTNSFIIGDCLDGIEEIPDRVYNLVEIDPPYAIDLMNKKKSEGESQYVSDNYNEIDKEKYEIFMPRLLKECYRVMADNSWLICWYAPEPWANVLYNWIIEAGFGSTRMNAIWTKGNHLDIETKGNPGQSYNPNRRLASSYESFYYAWKGSPTLSKPGHGNEFRHMPIPPQQKVHPTERPIPLMEEIYETFAFPGSRVLIPCAGSGNGILAAYRLSMYAVAFDLTGAYKDSFLIKAHNLVGK